MISLKNGDCLQFMGDIPDKSVDMILCDLPYGVLNRKNDSAKWDRAIPFDELWENYNRVIKDNGAIVLFGQGMFTAQLMMSNQKMWRYNLIWDKMRATGFLNAGRMPLRYHEDIVVFYKSLPTYNPQMEDLNGRSPNHPQGNGNHKETNRCYGAVEGFVSSNDKDPNKKFPRSIIAIQKEHGAVQYHPTQKPVALLEYLIKTYTNEGDTVLDNTMGSGSTGVACVNTNRSFIGIELDDEYFDIAKHRIYEALSAKQSELF